MRSRAITTIMRRLTGGTEVAPQDGPGLQGVSEEYWRASTYTYLGSGSYYERKAAVLDEVLAGLPRPGRAVDVGCGDGRHTLQIARHAGSVEGRDIGPALIAQATAAATAQGVDNATFTTADADEPLAPGAYDLVTALGFTSCLTDDGTFHGFLAEARAALRPGGHLVLVDSLGRRRDRLTRFDSGYVARYRELAGYRDAVVAAGFTPVRETDLGTPSTHPVVRRVPVRRNVNRLFLFRRT